MEVEALPGIGMVPRQPAGGQRRKREVGVLVDVRHQRFVARHLGRATRYHGRRTETFSDPCVGLPQETPTVEGERALERGTHLIAELWRLHRPPDQANQR